MKQELDVILLLLSFIVANIAIVKPEKAEKLETIIIQVTQNTINIMIECSERVDSVKDIWTAINWVFRAGEWEGSDCKINNNYRKNELNKKYSSKEKGLMMMRTIYQILAYDSLTKSENLIHDDFDC